MSSQRTVTSPQAGKTGSAVSRSRWVRARAAIDRTNALIGTAAILIGWVLGAATIWPFRTTIAPRTTVHISSPLRGNVNHVIQVRGIVKHLAPGQRLWVDIQDLSDLRNNPATEPCSVIGTSFRCGTIYVGASDQHAKEFMLQMWILGVDQMQQIEVYNLTAARRNYPGMTAPPDGTTIATSVVVIRN